MGALTFSSYFKFFFILSTASTMFSRLPKADNRKYPSPEGPNPLPGGAHHVALGEEFVEEIPRRESPGGLQPDVGGVDASVTP